MRGTIMEPIIADLIGQTLEEKEGLKVKVVKQKIIHPKYDFMFAHLDRVIEGDPRGPGVLEIKAPRVFNAKRCKREGMQPYYIVQLQHYLAVTGLKWGIIAVYDYDEMEVVDVRMTPDKKLIEIITEKAAEFWNYVLNREEPPEEEVQLDYDDVSTNKLVNMDKLNKEYWAHILQKYHAALATLEEAKADLELWEKRIKEEMERVGAFAAYGGGARVYWREQPGRKTLDKKAFAIENPEAYRIYESYLKEGKPFKTFKVYFTNNISGE